jgi:hypothetical protein
MSTKQTKTQKSTSGPAPRPKKAARKAIVKKTLPLSVGPATLMVIKLGSIVRDRPTNLGGMVTHMHIEMNRAIFYSFQPSGINPQNGEPLKALWCAIDRLEGGERIPFPPIPLHVLGTFAKDKASGFSGSITSVTLHISGCVHVSIQPGTSHPKTGGHIAAHDFDIRRVEGSAIPVMTEVQREKDETIKPSPKESASPFGSVSSEPKRFG